jgi:hypothetical protein
MAETIPPARDSVIRVLLEHLGHRGRSRVVLLGKREGGFMASSIGYPRNV